MADEIPGQNVVRVELRDGLWRAWCGPDPDSGVLAFGFTPASALIALAREIGRLGYVFDDSWRDDGRYGDPQPTEVTSDTGRASEGPAGRGGVRRDRGRPDPTL